MKKINWLIVSCLSIFLFACNGSSDDSSSSNPDNDAIVTSLTIQTLDANGDAKQSFENQEIITVVATVLDENGSRISGRTVNFSTGIGELSQTSKLSNNSGQAIVTISNVNQLTGAGTIAVNADDIVQETAFEYLAGDSTIIDDSIRIGYLTDDNTFIEGEIGLSTIEDTISAGGTLGLEVDVVDSEGQLTVIPTLVSFSSQCARDGNANIDTAVTTVNGRANATFKDVDCAGATGVDDVIEASITVNGIPQLAQTSISITGEELNSIEFLSADPINIVLKGTGGQGKAEEALLTFLVKGKLGNPLPSQEVFFSLDTVVGGISLSAETGVTDSEGLAYVTVNAGTVPTAVRVTASILGADGETIVTSQSALLSINSGLPTQRGMTVAASVLNPEALSGETSEITVWLLDNFQNPVPDGTTVSFTAEGGKIDPSCNTVGGSCSVTWEAVEPRLDDHRSTILAYALGNESFFDTNGNNIFDDADGGANTSDAVSSGFGRIDAATTGFVDMSEAWRDDNADNIKDVTEPFFDLNNNGVFDSGDGLFNGSQCEGGLCAGDDARAVNVRKALELVMSSSSANWCLSLSSEVSRCEESGGVFPEGIEVDLVSGSLQIASGSFAQLTLHYADTAFQTMPANTNVAVSSSAGSVEGTTNLSVTNNNRSGYQSITFLLINDGPAVGVLKADITSPGGLITSISLPVELL